MPILKTMDGVHFRITDAEAAKVIQAKGSDSIKDIHIRGCTIPKSAVALYSEEIWETKDGLGVLHDGTPVIKKFGQWVDANNPDVRLSWIHYPEIGEDQIMTPSEFKRHKPRLIAAEDMLTEYLAIQAETETGLATT